MNLKNLRVVLIETSHPGNIGAAARAMKTMGLSNLVLVKPKQFPCAESTARAAGADDILARAQVVDTLAEALAGCRLVLGSSARLRSFPFPQLRPRDAAERASEESELGAVALVFGTERTGMTNEQLMQCNALVNIPTNPEYSSLNVASAVQILSYEMRVADETVVPARQVIDESEPATADNMEGYFAHLQMTLEDIGFLNPHNPGQLMPRLRRFYNRARPTLEEVNIFRGILKATQKGIGK